MTDREKAIVMAYTNVCMFQGDKLSVFYDYVTEIMGSRMGGVQIAMLAEEIKRKAAPDFIALCKAENDKNVGGEWISVKDRLPKKGAFVLAVWHGDVKIVMYAPHRLGWANCATGYDSPNAVTYWMPLPEPPKEAEDANE